MTAVRTLSGSFLFAILALLRPTPTAAQQGTITGIIVDLETASPVGGASIEVLGQENATGATDSAGEFRLSVPAGTIPSS